MWTISDELFRFLAGSEERTSILDMLRAYRESSPPRGCVWCGFRDHKCDLVEAIEALEKWETVKIETKDPVP